MTAYYTLEPSTAGLVPDSVPDGLAYWLYDSLPKDLVCLMHDNLPEGR